MARDPAIPPTSFDEILAWLHPVREEAGSIYVQLRHDLARIFIWNGFADPEGLTDEVFDRVARKVQEVRPTFEGNPKLYFYGVARNLVREVPKRIRKQVAFDDAKLPTAQAPVLDEADRVREDCLNSCLETLSPNKKELIIRYYAKDRQAKIDLRSEMAETLGISVRTLRVRVHRLRGIIEACIEQCLDRLDQKK
jgi:RNA polymerase sigma factor (sigma-70 family)